MNAVLVLFDIDGTLVDTAGAGRRAIERSFRDVFAVGDISGPVGNVRFAGRTDPAIIADIAREIGVSGEELSRRYPEVQDAYVAALREELARPDPRRRVLAGVRPLLEALRGNARATVGLITGNIQEGARAKLDNFGLNPFFVDGGFASDHPDRDEIARIAHQRLCRRAGVRFPPHQVTVVGDTEFDIVCARRNGFRAIAVESGWGDRARLFEACPDEVFPDLTDLAAVMESLGLRG